MRELAIEFKKEIKQYESKIFARQFDINKPKSFEIQKVNRNVEKKGIKTNNDNYNKNSNIDKKILNAEKEIPFISLDSSDNTFSENSFFNINKINIESKRERENKLKEIVYNAPSNHQIYKNNNSKSIYNNNNNNDFNLIISLDSSGSSPCKSNRSPSIIKSSIKPNEENKNLTNSKSKEGKTIKLTKKKRNRSRKNKDLEYLNSEMTKFCFDSGKNSARKKKRASSLNVNYADFLNKSESVDMKREKEILVNSNPHNIFMIDNFPDFFKKSVFKKFYKTEQRRKENAFISIYLTNDEIPVCANKLKNKKKNKFGLENEIEDYYSEYAKFTGSETFIRVKGAKEENDFGKIKKKRASARQLARVENDKKSFCKAENEFYQSFGMRKVWDANFASQEMIGKSCFYLLSFFIFKVKYHFYLN